ncbi:ankyrin repeat domain-containing protein [Sphingobium sp. HWE2-09]|uniref:ankyrin repeat domain-containing protein n=1 Tax=Sphingobium sp. HWE2-09 TaxID=3108390 RepID=UPI002DC0D207|nr:ankyrin repeat domain-containing protein [Sphingobium sp. HWE2-09]
MTDDYHKIKRAMIIDIFEAARNDDVDSLKTFIDGGMSLNQAKSSFLDMTPMHVACIENSYQFVEYACENAIFDPWARDANLRTAFDHAAACGNQRAKEALFKVMYNGVSYDFTKHEFSF